MLSRSAILVVGKLAFGGSLVIGGRQDIYIYTRDYVYIYIICYMLALIVPAFRSMSA